MNFKKFQKGGKVPIKFTKPEVSETSPNSAIQSSIQAQKESNAEMAEMQKQMSGGGEKVTVPQMDEAGDSGNASISGGIANILKGAADSEYDNDVDANSTANSDYTGGRRTRRRRKKRRRKTKKHRKSKKKKRRRKTKKRRRKSKKKRRRRKTKKRRSTRKQKGSNIFNSKKFNPNKKMIHGMSEGTIRRLDNSDTSFGAIIRTRTNIRSGMSPLQAHRKAFNNSHLKEKDLRALPKYLEWKKLNTIQNGGQEKKQIIWKAYPITIKGIKYALKRTDKKNKKIGEVYDLDSYMAAKKSGVSPILIGKIAPEENNSNKIRFIKIDDPGF